MPRNNDGNKSSGVVLIIVLVLFMALSGLTLMTIEVSSRGAVEASRMRSEYEAGFKAEEALYMIYDLLKNDKTPFSDTKREKWAGEWEDDGLKIQIIPCNGKININSFIRSSDIKKNLIILKRLLSGGGDVKTLAGSIGVWTGASVDPKLQKLDNFFYGSQFPAYSPRGANFETPEEILLVRGWENMDRDWLEKTFTVWGANRLNINFVSRETLRAYFPELGQKVNNITHWARTRGFTDLSQMLSVTGMASDSSMYKSMVNEFSVKSDVFEARVTATVGDCTVVKRYIISRTSSFDIGEPKLVYQNDISVTFADNQ